MTQWRHFRLWFALALVAALIAAAALWLHGTHFTAPILPYSHTPAETSPLPIPPSSTTAAAPPSWAGPGAALLWAVLGVVLALGVAFTILHWYRRAA